MRPGVGLSTGRQEECSGKTAEAAWLEKCSGEPALLLESCMAFDRLLH